jgi:shikimate kinase
MGIGKTTVGAALAAQLGRILRDSDADIEALFGVSGAAVAGDQSVGALHELERAVLLGALAHPEPLVIAAAASVVEHEPVRRALGRTALVVHLVAPIDVILARQSAGTHRRPMSRSELTALLERRRPHTEAIEDLRLDAEVGVEELVGAIKTWIDERRGA